MDQRKNFTPIDIIKVDGHQSCPHRDVIVEEVPITLFLNDEEFVTLVCSPQHLKELAVGFLCSEGVLYQPDDLYDITIDEQEGLVHVQAAPGEAQQRFMKRYITSCCGRGRSSFYFVNDAQSMSMIDADLTITPPQIWHLARRLEEKSTLFKRTGGVHNAALCSPDEVIVFFEDIGRHNAVDKIFGHCFLNEIDMSDKVLVFSGRVSSEILIKVAKMEIPILISRSAATRLAVDMASQLGLTVVGFARGQRMNLYCHPHRIKLAP